MSADLVRPDHIRTANKVVPPSEVYKTTPLIESNLQTYKE